MIAGVFLKRALGIGLCAVVLSLSFALGFMARNGQIKNLRLFVGNASGRTVDFGYTARKLNAGESVFTASIPVNRGLSHTIGNGNRALVECWVLDNGRRVEFQVGREHIFNTALFGEPKLEMVYDGNEFSVIADEPPLDVIFKRMLR